MGMWLMLACCPAAHTVKERSAQNPGLPAILLPSSTPYTAPCTTLYHAQMYMLAVVDG